jgi:hypothetical protein
MTEQDLQRMERQWLPDNVPPLIAEVRRLRKVLLSQCRWCGGEETHEWDQPCLRQLRHDEPYAWYLNSKG